MKKAISIMLIACMFFSGCGEKDGAQYESTVESQNSNEQESKKSPEVTVEETDNNEKTIDDLEKFLIEKNVLTGDRTKMEASLIGGIQGFKYSDCDTEIYEYDINSTEYKLLLKGKEVKIKGMENFSIKANSINGKFVLIGESTKQIIDAFKSFA